MDTFLSASIRLTFARNALRVLMQDQPTFWLISKNRIDLFAEPTWFIHKEYIKPRTPSPHTWKAPTYDLSVWFQYLQGIGKDWRAATEADRAQFGNLLSQMVNKNGQEYDAKTINRYLTSIRRFYQFALHNRWYFGDIGLSMAVVDVRTLPMDADALAHTRSPSGKAKERDPLLLKQGRKDVVRPLQLSQLRKILNYLGPDPIERNGDERRIRNRLIVDLGWQCGCRLADVIGLTTIKLLSIVVGPDELAKKFTLIVESKGRVRRMLGAPGWLVLSLQEYILTERAQSERKGRKKSIALFLGHSNSKSAGKPLTKSAVQKMFRKACIACGVTEYKELTDPDTLKKYILTVPAHSYHDLRHNCAVLIYHSEKAMGNSEPWKPVQLALGHKGVQITKNTYLAHVEIFGEKQGLADFRQLIRSRNDDE